MDLLRGQHNLAGTTARFPRPGTLAEVYSRCVNTGKPLSEVVPLEYPWCEPHLGAMAELFRAFTARKRTVRPARLRRPSALLACSGYPGRMGRSSLRGLRLCTGRRVPGRQRPSGRHSASARSRWARPHCRRRRSAGYLRLSRFCLWAVAPTRARVPWRHASSVFSTTSVRANRS